MLALGAQGEARVAQGLKEGAGGPPEFKGGGLRHRPLDLGADLHHGGERGSVHGALVDAEKMGLVAGTEGAGQGCEVAVRGTPRVGAAEHVESRLQTRLVEGRFAGLGSQVVEKRQEDVGIVVHGPHDPFEVEGELENRPRQDREGFALRLAAPALDRRKRPLHFVGKKRPPVELDRLKDPAHLAHEGEGLGQGRLATVAFDVPVPSLLGPVEILLEFGLDPEERLGGRVGGHDGGSAPLSGRPRPAPG